MQINNSTVVSNYSSLNITSDELQIIVFAAVGLFSLGLLVFRWGRSSACVSEVPGSDIGQSTQCAGLQSNEARLESIFASLTDGLIVMDSRGIIDGFNPAAQSLFGYAKEEVLGKNVSLFMPATTKANHDDYLEKYLLTGEKKVIGRGREVICQHKDGSTFHAQLSVAEFEVEGDRFFTGTIQNISERVEMEGKLKSAMLRADKASNAKSEFLANMSHELRTPLNGVMGMLELLKDTQLNTRQGGFVTTAYNSANILLQVISSILDFSKIESEDFESQNSNFDLRQIIESSTSMATTDIGEKDIVFTYSVAQGIPSHLFGDAAHLQQIITNLVSNAVKFTESGQIELRVSVASTDESRMKIQVEVQDTGIGIAEAKIASLFEPFTQEDNSSTRRYGGSGLGLTVARRLVEFLGGEIAVRSTEGQGTTFWFSLWLDVADVMSEAEVEKLKFGGEFAKEFSALVVGDDPADQESLLEYFNKWGLDADSANTAGAALSAAQQAAKQRLPYQLIVLDDKISGLDGLELAGVIRSDPDLDDSQIILLKSGSDSDRATSYAGIRHCLSKPVQSSDLYDCLRQLESSANSTAIGQQQMSVSNTGNSRFVNKNILFVDDMRTNLKVGREMLRKFGLDADLARNGREAIQAFAEKQYDLVLMDCQMPVMDGYTATREIRQSEHSSGTGRHVPIIAVTAHALQGDREASLEAGMDDYLTKPFAIADIESILHRWL